METAELIKDIKKAMGVAGIVCSMVGIIATIVLYFVLSPLVDRMGATAVIAMDHTRAAVGGGAASLKSASDSIIALSDFSRNMSASMEKLQNGTSRFSSSLSNLSREIGSLEPSLPKDSLEQLNDSASSFSEFSAQLGEARSSLDLMSSSISDMSAGINSTRDDVASAEVDISEMKDTVNGGIGGLKLARLVGTFIAILFFLTLMCYSVGILL